MYSFYRQILYLTHKLWHPRQQRELSTKLKLGINMKINYYWTRIIAHRQTHTNTPINVNNIDRMILVGKYVEWPLYPMAHRWSDVDWDFISIVANHFRTGILMLNRNRYIEMNELNDTHKCVSYYMFKWNTIFMNEYHETFVGFVYWISQFESLFAHYSWILFNIIMFKVEYVVNLYTNQTG